MIMKGDWKLIHFFEDDSVQLYNVKEDIGERNDLSKGSPGIAKQLFDELNAWQKETKAAIPTVLNDSFDPSGDKGKNPSEPNAADLSGGFDELCREPCRELCRKFFEVTGGNRQSSR